MIREVEGPAGAPWERPLHGTLDRLVVESEAPAGNPLDDPSRLRRRAGRRLRRHACSPVRELVPAIAP